MSKKLILATLILAFSATSLFGQSSLNVGAIQKKIEVSNEQIQNPKRNTKAATWLSRGDAYLEAATAASTGIYQGQPLNELAMIFSQPQGVETRNIANNAYTVYIFPHIEVYTLDQVVQYWLQTTVIEDEALEKAYESYMKAYEVDPKSEKKAAVGVWAVVNTYKQTANNHYGLLQVKRAAENFQSVYEISKKEPIEFIDTASIYNAGYLFTFAKDFDNGEKALKEAIKYGYESDGDVYFYLFHCYYGMDKIEEATEALKTGLSKYPNNMNIVEGLVGIYTTTPGKDPKEIVAIVEDALKKDEKNEELWLGLGRIYDKLGDREQSVKSFEKAIEINPKQFYAYFNIGYSYILDGDNMAKDLSDNPLTGAAAHRARMAEIYDVFFKAIEPLEKAHEINPDSKETVELLKSVTFRLRERAADIKEKNLKYDALFKSM